MPTMKPSATFARLLLPTLMALLALLAGLGHAATDERVVVITHPGVPRPDATALRRIYTGRMIELGGLMLVPINARSGQASRDRFLQAYLEQDEEKYLAYWTVRRYIGKGMPPRELASPAEIIHFVQSTPGAIGYIDASELRPGLPVTVLR
ncbi:MAG: hypothetical protein RJA44_1406 [Pseudomonadota bacterium]|jgi:hypothetical protein